MSIKIREATRADLPTLLGFEQGIVAAERPYDHTLKPDPISYYDIGSLINSKDAYVAVAECDGDLVASGYAQKKRSNAYLTPEQHAFLGFMYVAPDHRGKGINRLILNALLDWARECDLPEIHLTVYSENKSAMSAYEKAGFRPYLTEMRFNLDE